MIGPRHRLSPGEQRLLKLLPEDGSKVDTNNLTRSFYKGRERPFNARVTVGGLVRSLVEKTKRGGSDIQVKRTDRNGPYPIKVWVERKE